MVTLARTTSGLLYQSNGSLTGWTGAAQWSTVAAVRFVAAPTAPIQPGAIFNQMKGEPKLRIVGSTWYLIYNDLVQAGTSRPGIQRSQDRGITWQDLGALTYASNPAAAGVALSDVYLDPNTGNWTLHAVTGPLVGNQGGVSEPYTFVIYQSTTGIQGPYTSINTITGAGASWANTNASPGGNYWDGTHYNLFGGGSPSSGAVFVMGQWQGATLAGAFTQLTPATPLYDVTVNGPSLTSLSMNGNEGPSFAYNSILNLYVLTCVTSIAAGYDFSTMLQTSATPTFATAGWKHVQWLCPADIPVMVSCVGALAHNGSNSQAATGPNGEMLLVTSGQDPRITDPGVTPLHYIGLTARYATLEPAAAVLRYAGAADTVYRQLVRALSHTDITVECASELTGLNASSGELHIVYRSDGTGNNEYRAVLGANNPWRLDKIVAGARTLLATGTGTQAYGNQGAALGMLHRLKVQVIGNTHTAWLDGELQYTFTDSSSPFTSGTNLAFAGIGANFDVINLSCRTSDTITVSGMQPLTSVWLRAACGIPIAPIVANASGVGTIAYGHYPLYSLDVAGTDFTVGADSRIWGGDTLQFSGLPASAPPIPALAYFT